MNINKAKKLTDIKNDNINMKMLPTLSNEQSCKEKFEFSYTDWKERYEEMKKEYKKKSNRSIKRNKSEFSMRM